MVDLVAAGHKADETDVIITLFRAYGTVDNDEFRNSILFWKNEWTSGTFQTAEALMQRADSKYAEMKDMNTWGKCSTKDEQIVALTAKINELSKNNKTLKKDIIANPKDGDGPKSQVPKWKYDKSLSNTKEYVRNGKTYKWCTGTGNGGVPM